jgi:hypothetical protein
MRSSTSPIGGVVSEENVYTSLSTGALCYPLSSTSVAHGTATGEQLFAREVQLQNEPRAGEGPTGLRPTVADEIIQNDGKLTLTLLQELLGNRIIFFFLWFLHFPLFRYGQHSKDHC